MNTAEILNKFVAKTDIRYYLKRPHRENGYLYATNGHILVRMADDQPEIVVDDSGEFPDCEKLLAKNDFTPEAFAPLVFDRPGVKPCRWCEGTGQVAMCPSCEGKGEFDHHGETYDCKYCACNGWVRGTGEICGECEGSGKNLAVAVQVGEGTFQFRYLDILSGLPRVKFAHNGDKNHPARFIFDGGIGLLMPFMGRDA